VHGDYNEDHGMITAILSEMTVSKYFINMKVKLLCLTICYSVTSLCKFSVKGFFMFKPHVYVSNQLVFNTGTSVEYAYSLYSHMRPLCHTLCLYDIMLKIFACTSSFETLAKSAVVPCILYRSSCL